MASPPRIDVVDAWHHVMNRGHNHRDIFRDDRDCLAFASGLDDITGSGGIEIHSYALMSNHFHLLVRTPHAGLGQAMQHLESVFAVRFNRRYGNDGAVFRGRYRSVLLDSESHFVEVPRYIDNNPVKAGIVSTPDQYRWSSHRVLALDEPAPDFLSTDVILPNYFDNNPLAYQAFVRRESSIGAVEYAESIESKTQSMRLSSAIGEYRRALAAMSTDDVIIDIERFVSATFGISRHLLRHRGRSHDQQAVSLVLTLLYRGGHATTTELAAEYGYASRSSVSSAINRFEGKAEREPALQAAIEAGLQLQLDRAA